MNLKSLNKEQDNMRELLIAKYAKKQISILQLSSMTGVAYTSLRRFIMGNKAHYANLIKIQQWLYQ